MTVCEVARYLRVRQSVACAWLESQGLLLDIAGRKRVHPVRLMDALGAPQPEPTPEPKEDRRLRVPIPQTDAF